MQSKTDPTLLMANVSGRLTSAGLPRLNLATGAFAVPPHIKHVLFDVGAFECSEFYQQLRPDWTVSHPWMRNVLVVAFEPTPSTYETHLRKCAHPQLWLFPAGVAEVEGSVPMHESRLPGCNTLSPEGFAGVEGKLGKANRLCSVEARGYRRVPVLPLSRVISLLPAALHVPLIKIDAQGLELQVLRSVGEALRTRVHHVCLEVQALNANQSRMMLVRGQPTREQVDEAMNASGFEVVGCEWQNRAIREQNCVYSNRALHELGAGDSAHEATVPSRGQTRVSKCTKPWATDRFI